MENSNVSTCRPISKDTGRRGKGSCRCESPQLPIKTFPPLGLHRQIVVDVVRAGVGEVLPPPISINIVVGPSGSITRLR
jgi:hypothetical protein